MKFIEIKEGVCIAKDEIIALEKIDEFNTRVFTEGGSFESNLPYTTLIQIIDSEPQQDVEINKKLKHISTIVDTLGHFAG